MKVFFFSFLKFKLITKIILHILTPSTTTLPHQLRHQQHYLIILVDKLAELEQSQLRKHLRNIENDAQSVEGKMLMYQRKYEAQKQAELQAQVTNCF